MLTQSFKGFLIKQGPRGENKKADALSKITSTSFAYLSKEVLMEELREKQINEKEMLAIVEEEGCTWMTLVYEYLTKEILPEDKKEARVICRKAGRYAIINKILYEKSFLGPWLRKLIRECNDCQVHRPVLRNPQQNLTPITSPWPFYKWGIDIAGPFLDGPGKVNSKVRDTNFKPADLVYRNNDASHAEDGGKLGPKLEGPYKVTEALGKGAYKLRNRKGNILPRTWNIYNLKKCYVHEM
ncbi:hypothetical protein Tco_0335488 [Tanacetum coccineum]